MYSKIDLDILFILLLNMTDFCYPIIQMQIELNINNYIASK